MGDERRVHLRIATTLPCVVQSKDNVHPATLLDLSRGGARLEIEQDIAKDHEVIVIGLALPDETIVLPGHMDQTTIGQERQRNAYVRMELAKRAGEG